jgi:hypothetical protein
MAVTEMAPGWLGFVALATYPKNCPAPGCTLAASKTCFTVPLPLGRVTILLYNIPTTRNLIDMTFLQMARQRFERHALKKSDCDVSFNT